jgi:hypothetical protein
MEDDAIRSGLHGRIRNISGAGYVHPTNFDHNSHVTSGHISEQEYARLMRKYHHDFPGW